MIWAAMHHSNVFDKTRCLQNQCPIVHIKIYSLLLLLWNFNYNNASFINFSTILSSFARLCFLSLASYIYRRHAVFSTKIKFLQNCLSSLVYKAWESIFHFNCYRNLRQYLSESACFPNTTTTVKIKNGFFYQILFEQSVLPKMYFCVNSSISLQLSNISWPGIMHGINSQV